MGTFGERLRELRQRAHLSQHALALKAGVGESYCHVFRSTAHMRALEQLNDP